MLYLIYRQDTSELNRVFNSAISLFGTPKLIVSDRGMVNGQVERYVRTVLNMIRVESNNKKSTWSDSLSQTQLVLNITKQKITQYSPLYLLIGTNAINPVIHMLNREVPFENSSPN